VQLPTYLTPGVPNSLFQKTKLVNLTFELIGSIQMITSLHGTPLEPYGTLFFTELAANFFFSDFKNTVGKGTLKILGGQNN
jgi:hypothetical protein